MRSELTCGLGWLVSSLAVVLVNQQPSATGIDSYSVYDCDLVWTRIWILGHKLIHTGTALLKWVSG